MSVSYHTSVSFAMTWCTSTRWPKFPFMFLSLPPDKGSFFTVSKRYRAVPQQGEKCLMAASNDAGWTRLHIVVLLLVLLVGCSGASKQNSSQAPRGNAPA